MERRIVISDLGRFSLAKIFKGEGPVYKAVKENGAGNRRIVDGGGDLLVFDPVKIKMPLIDSPRKHNRHG